MIANYHSIETFSGVDGPGIRYVLFLQGCNLACKYCHNADTIINNPNKSISVDEVVKDYLRYKSFYTRGGGITISGGEPFMQVDFIIELFEELKKYNVHTCIETQGTLFKNNDKFNRLIEITDLFIIDLKGTNNVLSQNICGGKINNTLKFMKYLDDNNRRFFISYVLLPSINDDDKSILELSNILSNYKTSNMSFKILPYHKLGVEKWENINVKYQLSHIEEPSKEQVEAYIKKIEFIINKIKENL